MPDRPDTSRGVTAREAPVAKSAFEDDEDRVGTRVGHFLLRAKLGAGGMGVVYEALDERLGRAVALKMLAATRADASLRARFLREARAVSRVQHPNVATIYEVGEDPAGAFIALELVRGETMRAWLRSERTFAERLRVVHAIAEAVAAAHAAQVVHRDLKPENVMITPAGVPKVLDFGLARHAESGSLATDDTRTAEGVVMGTPSYMSPEQVRGEAVDARSDVFSLGIVLYETFGGVRPFRGESPGAIVLAMGQPHAPVRAIAPHVPRALEAIIERCLAKDPAARYADARGVADALAMVPAASDGGAARRSAFVFVAAALAIGGFAAFRYARPDASEHAGSGAPSVMAPSPSAPVATTNAAADASSEPTSDGASAAAFVPVDPPAVLARIARAREHAAAGRIDDARHELDGCIHDEASPVACIVQRSRLLGALGECADAEADARAALELAPARTDARIALADALTITAPTLDAATTVLAAIDGGATIAPDLERARAGLDAWKGDFEAALTRLRAMSADARGAAGARLVSGALRELGREEAVDPPGVVDAGTPLDGWSLPLDVARDARACDGVSRPFDHMDSLFRVGREAETRGDRARACSAYGQILERWGNARTPSVTARRARARAAAVQCPSSR